MAVFELAIPTVLAHEGGYTLDQGGATNYGISAHWLMTTRDWRQYDLDGDGTLGPSDMRALTKTQAIALYRQFWWTTYMGFMASQAVATKLFDTDVNMGMGEGTKLLQQAVGVAPDGVFGPATLGAVNKMDEQVVLTKYRALEADHYRAIVAARPTDAVDLKGWLNRANS